MLFAEATIDVLQVIKDGGWVVGLLVILWTGFKKKWVFGYQLEECEKREQEWKSLALKSTHAAESAVTVGEHLVELKKEGE